MAGDKLTPQELEDQMYARVMERIEQEQSRKNEMLNKSAFVYGGKVLAIDISKPNQKFTSIKDDKGVIVRKDPILDEAGQATFWDTVYYCEVAHLGSSRKFVVPLDLGKDIEKGQDYLFEGDLTDVDNKLKVKLITKI